MLRSFLCTMILCLAAFLGNATSAGEPSARGRLIDEWRGEFTAFF